MEHAHTVRFPTHLPVYLDEFVFRQTGRGTPMAGFQTLLGLAHEPITYREIINRPPDSNLERTRTHTIRDTNCG